MATTRDTQPTHTNVCRQVRLVDLGKLHGEVSLENARLPYVRRADQRHLEVFALHRLWYNAWHDATVRVTHGSSAAPSVNDSQWSLRQRNPFAKLVYMPKNCGHKKKSSVSLDGQPHK